MLRRKEKRSYNTVRQVSRLCLVSGEVLNDSFHIFCEQFFFVCSPRDQKKKHSDSRFEAAAFTLNAVASKKILVLLLV